MTSYEWIKKHIFSILDVTKFLLLLILVITFINFNIRLAEQSQAIYAIGVQQKQTAQAIQENTTRELNKLNDHVDCIFNYFTNPNRANTVIASAKTCNIVPVR